MVKMDESKKLEINYHIDGLAIPDQRVMEWAETLADMFNKGASITIKVSAAIMVDAIRLLVVRGILNHKEVRFRYKNKIRYPNRFGVIEDWPKGFCDTHHIICEELLKAAFKKKKEELKNDKEK